jgi:protein-tyrosine phosphatase
MCSWQKYGGVMTVIACWEGLEVAQRHGWIDRDCLNDDVFADVACSQYRSMVAAYDASWIVPGKLMVAADPTTTLHDPNPETFLKLWSTDEFSSLVPTDTHNVPLLNTSDAGRPEECRLSRELSRVTELSRECTRVSDHEKAYLNALRGDIDCLELCGLEDDDANTISRATSKEHPQANSRTPSKEHPQANSRASSKEHPQTNSRASSKELPQSFLKSTRQITTDTTETVCKEYISSEETVCTNNDKEQHVKAFSDFLEESEIKLMVRCNYSNEQGMPKTTYSADNLKQFGVDHKDIQIIDKYGALPARHHIAALLEAGTPVLEGDAGAVLVHCKGGFGRSAVLACCLAIYTYDIPGRALLGWVRIARPGAIATVLQEKFLVSLQGRKDVASFAGIRQQAINQDASQVRCGVGCMVQ